MTICGNIRKLKKDYLLV